MYYIGLMSGTSVDGIDAAVVELSDNQDVRLVASYCHPYPAEIRRRIQDICQTRQQDLDEAARLHSTLGELFAEAVQTLLQQAGLTPNAIRAIGSHGQTLRHEPDTEPAYTLQVAHPAIIALRTGITTVGDFRAADIAAGGQGAPLAPAFHNSVFRCEQADRVITNIGGIANITVLPKDPSREVIGFDTGPGNTLMDQWIAQQQDQRYDTAGAWGATGTVIEPLLQAMLADSYFRQAPPKSTGREYFHLDWVTRHCQALTGTPAAQDVQHTLAHVTAASIAQAVQQHAPETTELYVCGGGAHNPFLLQLLQHYLGASMALASTEKLGLAPDWVEAAAFAWLAQQALDGTPANLPSVTGARRHVILGAIYPVLHA